jgi:hypothetical protein
LKFFKSHSFSSIFIFYPNNNQISYYRYLYTLGINGGLASGNIGLSNGTSLSPTTPTYNLSFAQGGDVIIGIEATTSQNNGYNATLRGSNAKSGVAGALGGSAIISTGGSVGTGGASIEFHTPTPSTGTTANTPSLKGSIDGNGNISVNGEAKANKGYKSSIIDTLTNATADTLFSIPLAADSVFNATMTYGISVTDGDTTQAESGIMLISALNTGAALQESFTTLGSTQPTGMLGTLSKSLSLSLASDVLYVIVTVTSDITPTAMSIRVTPDFHTAQTITEL